MSAPWVIVTRPEPQAQALARRLREAGFTPRLCPLLRLERQSLTPSLAKVLRTPVTALLCVSVPALQFYQAALAELGMSLPVECPAFAVGAATAEALREAGFVEVYQPAADAAETSEGLLRLPAFTRHAPQDWLLVRGVGGRDALAEAIDGAGGTVLIAELYRRGIIERDWSAELAAWRNADLAAILISNGEALQALAGVDRSVIEDLRLIVPTARVAKLAAELGFSRVDIAEGASDAAMLACLLSAPPRRAV